MVPRASVAEETTRRANAQKTNSRGPLWAPWPAQAAHTAGVAEADNPYANTDKQQGKRPVARVCVIDTITLYNHTPHKEEVFLEIFLFSEFFNLADSQAHLVELWTIQLPGPSLCRVRSRRCSLGLRNFGFLFCKICYSKPLVTQRDTEVQRNQDVSLRLMEWHGKCLSQVSRP